MSHQVNWSLPLTRLNSLFPGQIGVAGTWNKTGLRQTGEGAIFYVDPNYPGVTAGGVAVDRDGTDPDAPLATVAQALTKCSPYRGDVIAVMAANTYEYTSAIYGRQLPISETVVVDVPGVKIVGVAQADAIGITWMPPVDNDVCLTVIAPDVLIEGFSFFTLSANNTAIYCDWNGVTTFGDATVIRNCYFDEALLYGIVLEFAYHTQIYNNEFRCEANGACIWTDVAFSASSLVNIYRNRFHTSDAAITLPELSDSHIFENSFYNNLAATPAAATDLGVNLTGGATNQVYNNVFSCVLPAMAAGDWDDFNDSGLLDSWVGNVCMNGLAVTNPVTP